MRALLDTHVFLWLLTARRRLAVSVLDRLADPASEVFISAATAWEIAIKHELGWLTLPEPAADYVPRRVAAMDGRELPISHADALDAGALPRLHRDPFDRLLVAQARRHGMVLVTADPAITQYDVEVLPAR